MSDSDSFEAFLLGIESDSAKAQDACLKSVGQVTRDAVVRNLERSNISDPEHVHLKDDVQLSITKDKYGGKVAKVRGGKKTGTLWHIVNDGTYRSRGTHFMDKATSEVDSQIDGILDATLAFLGE